jgi:hypothetical protein
MMAFITHCWKKARFDLAAGLLGALLAIALPAGPARAETSVEVTQLRLERSQDAVMLTAGLKFELPPVVEEALLKGVAVFFVAEAEIYRERWYWTDKKVASAQRHMRLAFQPLTRRWRMAVSSGLITSNGLGVALNQSFDTLDEALAAVRRLSGWRIAELADIEAGTRHRLEFRFRLDTAQLPRPLQIGALGQSDWTLSATASQRLELESLK